MNSLQCKFTYHTIVKNTNNLFSSSYIFSFSLLSSTENLPADRTLSDLFKENGLNVFNHFSDIQEPIQCAADKKLDKKSRGISDFSC